MGMKLYAVGGYDEVGRNMTAVDVDDDIIILDMGLFIPAIIGFEEEQERFSEEDMIRIKAIPDDTLLRDHVDRVKAIVIGHPHLDHLGGFPFLAKKYKNAPVIGTPYTINVLKRIMDDKGKKLTNKVTILDVGKKIKISDNVEIEFINITHSTLGCALVVL
ncbi:MAG: MBL fold metallo-hydrolase, partial [Nanoarchaeota archaeon]